MVITTALAAAGAMLIQDICGVLLVQAEARNRAGLAALSDSIMWLAQISTISISVTTLQGHHLGAKAIVLIAVELANVAGCYAGVAIGKRWVKERNTGTIEAAACACGCPVTTEGDAVSSPAPTPEPLERRKHHEHLIKLHYGDGRSLGDRVADRFVTVFGGWSYIIWQTVVIIAWMAGNAYFLRQLGMHEVPDPYPFILLNLAFSAQAAYAAPLILMAQNRGVARDKDFAQHQFEIIDTTHQMLAANTDLTQQVHDLTEQVHALVAATAPAQKTLQRTAPAKAKGT